MTDNNIKKIILLSKVFYGTSVYTCIVIFSFKSSINDTVEVIDLREGPKKEK
ncbi:N-6 DNA methylase [Aquimarina algicola]|uniref:N-6 DNA methylase n=1 Tax=Aquimarina algicola TaxID=2589995 RepID=UPI001CF2330C